LQLTKVVIELFRLRRNSYVNPLRLNAGAKWQQTMSQEKLDTESVVRLLLDDALPRLGQRATAEIHRLVANCAEIAATWMQDGESLLHAQRSFDRWVVEGLQQPAHDVLGYDMACVSSP
jgi:hypothetical protein